MTGTDLVVLVKVNARGALHIHGPFPSQGDADWVAGALGPMCWSAPLLAPDEQGAVPAALTAAEAVVAAGNPGDGFEFYGPFCSEVDAISWANEDPHLPDEWWVLPFSALARPKPARPPVRVERVPGPQPRFRLYDDEGASVKVYPSGSLIQSPAAYTAWTDRAVVARVRDSINRGALTPAEARRVLDASSAAAN